jgi:hypothetical protein
MGPLGMVAPATAASHVPTHDVVEKNNYPVVFTSPVED